MTTQRLAQTTAEANRGMFIGYGNGFLDGTFTPYIGGSSSDGSFTYTAQQGVYRQVGDLVFFQARVQTNTMLGVPSGNLQVKGLPFAANAAAVSHYALPIGYCNDAFLFRALLPAGATAIDFYDDTAAVVPGGVAAAGLYVIVGGWYIL